ncbi:MAG TPA: apolipoprotein N-acyltransferase [Kofleriaceae bacterium]
MPARLRVAAAVIAAAVMFTLAAPPIGVAPLAVIALAPMIHLAVTAASWRSALWRGALGSLAITGLVFRWLPGSVHAFFGLPTGWSWLAFPVYAVIGQPQLIAWAVVRWRWRAATGPGVMLASAAAYTGLDWLLPKLFHDTLGVALFGDGWLIQIVDVGGVYLLTFAAMLTTELAHAAVRGRRRVIPAAIGVAAMWAAIAAYGAIRRGQVEAALDHAPALQVGVIQANIGNIEKEMAAHGNLDGIVGTLRRYGELSDQLARSASPPELLIWPETAYPLAYGAHRSALDDSIDDELAHYLQQRKLPLLFGGFDRKADVEYNSALLLAPSGVVTAYHKRILIPFGEYWPLIGRARFGTGDSPATLDVPRAAGAVRIAPVICYESLFTGHAAAGVADGARALINLTNDSWFVSEAEQRLHLTMAALRSIETRRAQVRATNTGISALVLPTGAIVDPGPLDQPAALRYALPLLDDDALGPTPVMRLGNWPGPACLIGALLAGALSWRRRRRPRPGPGPESRTARG